MLLKEKERCIKLVKDVNKKLITFIENNDNSIEDLTYINNVVQDNFDDIINTVKLFKKEC